ncbi:MAG: response regulator transcription factor [Verrucomicrobiota bacterium]
MIKKYKVFLVDDHELVREGLTRLINQQKHMEVCGEAEDLAGALEGLSSAKADIVVVDLFLKRNFSGLDLIKELRLHYPHLKIIVVSMYEESIYGVRSLKAGAQGYVMKKESSVRIIEAIEKVMAGGVYMSETLANSMLSEFQGKNPSEEKDLGEILSDREIEVFHLLGSGKTTIQVSEAMNLSSKTVHSYCSRIKEKLRLTNYNELLREAVKWVEKE